MGAAPERRRPVRWGAALALLLCASVAQAQDTEDPEDTGTTPLPAFSLERLELNPGLGPMTMGSGELLPQKTFRVSLVGHYQRSPLAIQVEGERLSLVQDRTTGWLALAYGVLPWLELDAHLSGVVVQQGGDLASALGTSTPSRRGLGAAWLSTRAGFVNPSSSEAFRLAMELGVGLPVGPEAALAHDPGVSARGRLMMGKRWGLFSPALEAGILLRSTAALETSAGLENVSGNEARFGAGLTVGRDFRGEVAARAAFSWEESRLSAEVVGGLRYTPTERVEVFTLVGTGFGAEPGTPRFRALAGLAFRFDADPRPEPEEVIYELVTPLPPRRPSAQTPQEDTSSKPSSPGASQGPSSPDSAEPAPSPHP